MSLIDRLNAEADLCKNEGADDIASLLWEAAAALAHPPEGAQPEPSSPLGRDGDWILAMGHALGLDSGYSVPIVPTVEAFKKLFAAVIEGAQPEPAEPMVSLSAALAMLPTDRHSVDVQWVAFRLRSLAAGAQTLPAAPPIDSPQVTSLWQAFCRTADYRRALEWAGKEAEIPGALFVAFRSGLAAAPGVPSDLGASPGNTLVDPTERSI